MADPTIKAEEIIGLDASSQAALEQPGDLAAARAFFVSYARETGQSGSADVSRAAWIARLTERLPETVCDDPQLRVAMHMLYDVVRPRDQETIVPGWFDPAMTSAPSQQVYAVELWQEGNQLRFKTAAETADDTPLMRYGSPLGVVQTASGDIKVATSPARSFWRLGTTPAWASDWGVDPYGPWVILRLEGVEQRLRWIAPGAFRMGSPEDEEGRYEDEGPLHPVQLTQGFWLFDTPCTQALWEAVMGENPSRFPGANRPVENVSWEDCQAFISKLNHRLPGLDLRLPTEAQWEYACRAGTQEAHYESDLDAIAWYNENSSNETHDVKQKRPNSWGLYDMLGNVAEWCHDGHRDYEPGLAIDPIGRIEAGAVRVFRGGGWFGLPARLVRAAYRLWGRPGDRDGDLGFRCLSSGGEPERARETWGELERQAEPAETTPRQPAARLLHVRGPMGLSTVFPDADHLEVSTDRERLHLGRIVRPSWAKAIGRDGYGLWVILEVGNVRQRLRWIVPGRFWMGSPEDEEGRDDDEGPRHEVVLSEGFWLFDTPCTQALWEAVMDQNPSSFLGAQRPVEQVSWEDCQAFIGRLNDQFPELGLRLPTEAQWEYACRAGTQEARYDADLDAIAWYEANDNGERHDVKQKRPNGWGLYDMLGNVAEWCHDGERDYEPGLAIDPVGSTESGAVRVIRGGRWFGGPAQVVRAAFRGWDRPGSRSGDLGFRCLSSGVSSADGMRRARRRAVSGAREDRDRSDAVSRRGRRRR